MATHPFLAVLILPALQGREVPQDPIATDRPDFTESSTVVPNGWLQIESGVTYQRIPSGSVLSGPELLLRKGLGGKSELRLGLPDYNLMRVSGSRTTGWGDVYVGAKFQIGPLPNGDGFAVIPALSVPSNDSDFSSESVDPEVKLCWSRDLGEEWSLSAMSYGLWTTDDDKDRVGVFQQTLSLGRGLSNQAGAFLEYAGTFQRGERPQHLGHLGFTYQPDSNRQFDLHAGLPLIGPDRRPFFAAGYSVRF